MAVLYLLHFERPHPNGRHPQHYMGVAADLEVRMAEHRRGNPGKGGALTRSLKVLGIAFVVAKVWEFAEPGEAFREERRLKRRKQHSRYCPVCRPE